MGSLLARLIGSIFGLKVFWGGVMMTILGIALYNGAVEMIEEALNFGLTQINGQNVGAVQSPTVTGFAGWAVAQLKLPECVSVIVSCTTIKFILRKIPFLKW